MSLLNTLSKINKLILLLFSLLILTACGEGDSSNNDTAQGSGSTASIDYSKNAAITSASIDDSQILTVNFQLVDENGVAIINLVNDDLRFTVAKLTMSANSNLTGNWQSYFNQIEQPGVGEGTVPKLQAMQENGADGVLVNNNNGTYVYTFNRSLNEMNVDILSQARIENINLTFKPSLTHRVAVEVRNQPQAINTTLDWIPETGKNQYDGIWSHNIVATQNCNSCHGSLVAHGGSRVEVKYCVTCHNIGSSDANSGNTVNFKNMIHKIHRGKNLPSVLAGGKYSIYGYRDTEHNYSELSYPGDILTCNQCHAGTASEDKAQIITKSGDNWQEIATMQACGSCHDDVDFQTHLGGQTDNENCNSCHQNSAIAGAIADSHKNIITVAKAQFSANIIAVSQTMAGQLPQIQFSIVNPLDDDKPYDILSDAEFTQANGLSRLSVTISWSTLDYINTANQGDNASSVQIDALTNAVAVGDGSFIVTSKIAIPDGSTALGFTATGSGAVVIEGHPAVNITAQTGQQAFYQAVPLTNVVSYFSIDEATGQAIARREIIKIDKCLTCHGELSLHGGNRTDSIESCVTCHNPRNTDIRVRDVAQTPPTDGKDEESLDFKTMIHGIHAVTKREIPLQVVGYKGFATHVYDRAFPRGIGDCTACHDNDSYSLPISETALGTTIDTGIDREDPNDDLVVSPTAAVCSSCHDANSAQGHMELNGADFSTNQADLDNGLVIEQCSICHGAGRTYDVKKMHPIKE
mgnify:CR=1 FL=1